MNTKSSIELEFKIGHCNGTMSMQIFVDDAKVADYSAFEQEQLIFKQIIDWPAVIKIVISNKNLSCDTEVDASGRILRDKYIELKKVTVDNLDSSMQFMKTVTLNTDNNESLNTLYWGFNGTVSLKFDQADSFAWHLTHQQHTDDIYIIDTIQL
jgi:hypothetical protein